MTIAASLLVANAQTTVPAGWAYPTSAKDTSKPGLNGKIAQAAQSAALLPSLTSAEAFLAGTLIDPATGSPYVNMVVSVTNTIAPSFLWEGYAVNVDGTFIETNVNYSATDVEYGYADLTGFGAFNTANGYPDANFPGFPGSVDATFQTDYVNAFNFAVELTAYLELPAGQTVLGVHSAHAVQIAMHPNDVRDVFRVPIVDYPTTSGQAHRTAVIDVEQAGLYPVRVLQSHWNGTASLEFYSADPADPQNTRILINDPKDIFSIKAWRAVTVPTRPYVKSVSPAISATGVSPAEPIVAVVANPDANPIAMLVNGAAVTPAAVTNGNEITFTYNPPAPFPGGESVQVEIQYGGISGQYTYVTRTGRKVLMIGGGATPGSGEQAAALRLAEKFGLDTTYIDDNALAGAGGTNAAAGHVLVINGSSVNSGLPRPHRFEELDIPFMNVEQANVGDFKLRDATAAQAQGPTTTDIILTNNPTHELSAGLPEGLTTVFAKGVQMHNGTVPASGIGIAITTNWESQSNGAYWAIYGIDAGGAVELSDGTQFVHPARRVQFGFMGDQGAADFTEAGWMLFDAAIAWLVPAPPEQPKLTASRPSPGTVRISWTGSGVLYESATVNGQYSESSNQANPQDITGAGLNGTMFYQVR